MQRSRQKPSLADRMARRHFRKCLPQDRRRAFDRMIAAMLEDETQHAPDPVTYGHLVFASCLLCSVEQWQAAGLSRSQAKTQVRKAVLCYGRRSSAIAMWLTGKLSKDPFKAIARHAEEKAANGYGPTFSIAHEATESGFASVVTRCGYRTFLGRHDADDLIDLFCAWDKVWIDALPAGIKFSRPATLAEGGDACRFQFIDEQ